MPDSFVIAVLLLLLHLSSFGRRDRDLFSSFQSQALHTLSVLTKWLCWAVLRTVNSGWHVTLLLWMYRFCGISWASGPARSWVPVPGSHLASNKWHSWHNLLREITSHLATPILKSIWWKKVKTVIVKDALGNISRKVKKWNNFVRLGGRSLSSQLLGKLRQQDQKFKTSKADKYRERWGRVQCLSACVACTRPWVQFLVVQEEEKEVFLTVCTVKAFDLVDQSTKGCFIIQRCSAY